MQHALSDDSKGRAFTWYSIRSEISIVNRLFRTMQSTTLISVWMEHWRYGAQARKEIILYGNFEV